MPKEKRVKYSSLDGISPYSCSSKISDCKNNKSSLHHVADEKEWEDTRCPICMDHPHNPVLLLCSSHEKGCRPFICDTSIRHSNCFDQYRKSSAATSLHTLFEDQQPYLTCPLCRGKITGWDVVHPARRFMNSKSRSCALETCGFNGNYTELRRHARIEHPFKHPSEASPSRWENWAMLEQQRETEDALLHQSDNEPWPGVDELVDDLLGEGSSSDFSSFRSASESIFRSLAEYMGSFGNSVSGDQPQQRIQDDVSILRLLSSYGRQRENDSSNLSSRSISGSSSLSVDDRASSRTRQNDWRDDGWETSRLRSRMRSSYLSLRENSRYVSRFSIYSIRPVRAFATRSFPLSFGYARREQPARLGER